MKNKLLVSGIAMAIAVFAFTSCETKSNVMNVCDDLVKESIHKSARSLLEQNGESLSISEYEFLGGVDDNRLLYRYIAFGNGVYTPKKVDTLTYTYGEWSDQNTNYSLNVSSKSGETYTLIYRGNALITPDNRVIGGATSDNLARVEKWEKTISTLQNTQWAGVYEGDFVLDSVFRDSIRTTFIPPVTFKTDTIKVFVKMDTVAADTTCYYTIEFNHDANTLLNTGHLYKKEVRSKYDLKTKTNTILSEKEKVYDCKWFFTDVTSEKRFTIQFVSTTSGVDGDQLSISKYEAGDSEKQPEFICFGATFNRTNP